MKEIYDIIRQLSEKGISDMSYKNKILYIKGDYEKTKDILNRLDVENVDRGFINLNPFDFNENIIREIFYLALDRLAHDRGFYPIKKIKKDGKKRIIPNIFEHFDKYKELGFVEILDENEDVCITRGLWFFLDFYKSSDVLWIDVYSPLVSLKEKRLLNPREAKKRGLREKYVNYIPTSLQRRQLLKKLVKEIFKDDATWSITFLDGDCVVIDSSPIKLSIEGNDSNDYV